MKKIRISIAQIDARDSIDKNFNRVKNYIRQAKKNKAAIIAFPECFLFRGERKQYPSICKATQTTYLPELKTLARQNRIAILCGTILEPSPMRNKYYNSAIVLNNQGGIIAHYRKIHLFDVSLTNKFTIKESAHLVPGTKAVTASLHTIKFGLSICYDLRFPELFRQLTDHGSRIIFLPANFTRHTGTAHWKPLIRARAIENQVFMVCPNLSGINPDTGKESYGHSIVVDPWGTALAEAGLRGSKLLTVDLNLDRQNQIRRQLPCLKHRRLT